MYTAEELITPEQCCIQYNIELSFIDTLSEYGWIEIVSVEEKHFIHKNQLYNLEKFIRLHYDLNINMEGIDAVSHLLLKMKTMQEEISILKTKLHLYTESE